MTQTFQKCRKIRNRFFISPGGFGSCSGPLEQGVKYKNVKKRKMSKMEMKNDDTRAFKRVLQRDAIPTTDKRCLTLHTQALSLDALGSATLFTRSTRPARTSPITILAHVGPFLPQRVAIGRVRDMATSVSSLAYPNMVPWSPATTLKSSLPTCRTLLC